MQFFPDQCMRCRHFRPASWVCSAFPAPGSMPRAILVGAFDHTRPYLDPETGLVADRGIRFEPIEEPA